MRLHRRSVLVVAFVVVAWLFVVGFADLFAGCGGGGLGATPTGPPLKASPCLSAGTAACRSPDGAWLASVGSSGACSIYLTRVSTGRRVRMFRSQDADCPELTWGKPHQLLFHADNSFYTLDPTARYPVTRPAAFAELVVSPNRRWVAGTTPPEPPKPHRQRFTCSPQTLLPA